jgi:type I restriction enzyme S subunit
MFEHPHPPDWNTTPVYSLANWQNGLAFRNIHFAPTGRPVIKIAELKGGITAQTRFTEDVFDDAVRVPPGDMLFSWSGNPETSIDVFLWDGPEGWLNQHIFKVTPREGVNRRFLYYLLKFLKPSFTRIASDKQTTGLGHVTVRDLKAMTVGLPSPVEQEAIVEALAPLDDKIDLNRRLNADLEAMAQAVFQSWFVDFDPVRAKAEGRQPDGLAPEIAALFPDRLVQTEFGEIPEGWEIMPLPSALQINPTKTLQKGALAPYLDMAAMPTRSARAEGFVMREYNSGMRFTNGDTLVARITPCLENGKTCYVDFLNSDQVGWGSTEYIVLRSKGNLPLPFTYFLARSSHFRSFAIGNMTGSSGRQRVPVDCFNKFMVVIPSGSCLQYWGELAINNLTMMRKNDLENVELIGLQRALLTNILSGDSRVVKEAGAD